MPEDKWGIPYWYPTKKTAGVSGKGVGFFWQQNNNIRVDEDAGMVRIGKETDNVEVINTTTGEWMFPFNFNSGDGLSLSGPTGHHSGGEEHGCEGFTYMINVTLSENPPKFRFRKEMYHVNYDDHPSGDFTHPLVNYTIVGSGWNGYGWVRYNKKGGRADGGDSVVCEAWWNPDPDNHLHDWTMLKRIEDRGEGITNWGDGGASCDGTEHQVGTWSNIQFRFKVDASDFSLHPLEPETNEGDNIHSIGEADMSFADSEDRGYGYQARMPRDVEMKCLFRMDDSSGETKFKNISLREIDPTLSFEDNPTEPPPNETPTESTTVQVFFKFQNDINHLRVSPCAGTGGGGGSGGSTKFYSVAVDNDKELSDSSTFQNRTRLAESVANTSSVLKGKIIKQIDIPLKKAGSPAASPTVHMKIWSSGGSVIYDSTTTFDPSTFTTSFVTKTFDFSSNTHVMVTGDRVGVEYTGTSSSNYVVASYWDADIVPNTTHYQYEGTSWETKSRELSCDMWE